MQVSFEELVRGTPAFVNVGVRAFGDSLRESGYEVVDVDWSPPARGDPKLAALLDDVVRQTGSDEAYLVNLAMVLSRERRIHLTLPEDHPLRLARLPAIDAAWARARERLWAAAGRRLFAPAGC